MKKASAFSLAFIIGELKNFDGALAFRALSLDKP
jgi:hypothetical protein